MKPESLLAVTSLVSTVLGAPAQTLDAADKRQLGGGGGGGLFGGLGGSEGADDSGSGGLPGLGGIGGGGDSGGDDSGSGGLLGGFMGGSGTENGVKDNSGCKPLTFIFARGTGEMGNMGTVVGPPVASALGKLVPDGITVQGVDYPASAMGNAEMGGEGGTAMAKLVQQSASQCPDSKVVLGGYSQGAMVVHRAAGSLETGQAVGAVTFGDPLKTMPLESIDKEHWKMYCAQGDPVCLNGGNVMAHLSYGGQAEEAAVFLAGAAGLQ